ncbi:hypothetical protein M405DRAFT_865721 [Rhizopogon salebrosus TDB-379]|nr:hypothetical protein M405DRAFT_865721 [Rhizopogon salebrosus TDB-379]
MRRSAAQNNQLDQLHAKKHATKENIPDKSTQPSLPAHTSNHGNDSHLDALAQQVQLLKTRVVNSTRREKRSKAKADTLRKRVREVEAACHQADTSLRHVKHLEQRNDDGQKKYAVKNAIN